MSYSLNGELLEEYKYNQNNHWNNFNQITKLKDALGQVTTYEYDKLGRLIKETDFEGITSTYSYNKLSQILNQNVQSRHCESGASQTRQSIDCDPQDYAYTYDKLGRLIKRSAKKYNQSYTYDALGRLLQSFDNNDPNNPNDDVKVNYTYNSLNHILKQQTQINGKAFTIAQQPNIRGNITSLTYPSGEVIKREYTQSGYLKALKVNDQTLTQYDYTLLGKTKTQTLGNGVIKENTYDNMLRLVSEGYKKDQDTLNTTNYSYDKLGRIILKEEKQDRKWQAYNYNTYNQLTKVAELTQSLRGRARSYNWNQIWQQGQQQREYAYNLEGQWQNILEKNKNNKAQNTTNITKGKGYQYETFGDLTLKYDNRGNLIQKGKKEYEYDAWNRLTKVKENNQILATYTYDAHNRRQTKVTFSKKETTTNTTHRHCESSASEAWQSIAKEQDSCATAKTYTYAGWSLLEEYTNNDLTKKYYHGKTLDDPIAFTQNNKTYYYHKNIQGSITAISNTKGQVLKKYTYNEYGEFNKEDITLKPQNTNKKKTKNQKEIEEETTPPESGTDFENNFTYTAQYYDKESDLYYYKNRYYDAKLGRFLSKDPLGLIDGPNQYAYVNNDPLNNIDPMGTWQIDSVRKDDTPIHETITENAYKKSEFNNNFFKNGLIEGVRWNDTAGYWRLITLYQSHKGEKQYWHSMSLGNEKNRDVLDKILKQAKEWYQSAKCFKKSADGIVVPKSRFELDLKNNKMRAAGFELGHILHMVQDSFAGGHTIRNSKGVVSFQNYKNQDSKKHDESDKLTDLTRPMYVKSLDASTKIVNFLKNDASWNEVKTFLVDEVYNLQNPDGKAGLVSDNYKKD